MSKEERERHLAAEEAIRAKADDLLHSLGMLVEVSYSTLADHGILEAWLLSRGKDSTDGKEYDYVTIGQAKALGLINT